MAAFASENIEGGSSLLNKLIISTLAAYIAADLTDWYTIPEKLICCIGLGLIAAAVWIQIEERRTEHDNNNGRV